MEGVLSAFLVSLFHHLKTLKLFYIDILVNCSSCENCDERKINFPEELQDLCSLEFTRNLFQSRLKLNQNHIFLANWKSYLILI